MPAQMKRPAAATAADKRAKRAKEAETDVEAQVDPMVDKCKAIAKMVGSADGYPAHVLSMLSGTVLNCLKMAKDERHEYQENVAKMVGEVLTSVETSRIAKVEALKGLLTDADGEKSTREATLEAATTRETTCREELEAAQKALDEACAAKTAAEKAVKGLAPELKKASADAQIADADLLNCRSMLATFKELEEGKPPVEVVAEASEPTNGEAVEVAETEKPEDAEEKAEDAEDKAEDAEDNTE